MPKDDSSTSATGSVPDVVPPSSTQPSPLQPPTEEDASSPSSSTSGDDGDGGDGFSTTPDPTTATDRTKSITSSDAFPAYVLGIFLLFVCTVVLSTVGYHCDFCQRLVTRLSQARVALTSATWRRSGVGYEQMSGDSDADSVELHGLPKIITSDGNTPTPSSSEGSQAAPAAPPQDPQGQTQGQHESPHILVKHYYLGGRKRQADGSPQLPILYYSLVPLNLSEPEEGDLSADARARSVPILHPNPPASVDASDNTPVPPPPSPNSDQGSLQDSLQGFIDVVPLLQEDINKEKK